ncbi:MAG: hypothetical protein FWC70_00270 [Defluviitaleaceae bacterium]|nr:hypothetical protein [Defluviitaleaceae bacterium]
MDDKNLLIKYRSIDFSAESKNREKNLELLKSKLENGETKMKNFKKPVAIIAAVVAILLLSVGALAAGPAVWRQIETRVIEGNGDFGMWVLENGDASTAISVSVFEMGDECLVVEIDGEEHRISDIENRTFENLDEALAHFAAPVLLPADLEFVNASVSLSPLVNPDGDRAHVMHFLFNGDAGLISLQLSYIPPRHAMPGETSFEETKIFGDSTVTVSGLSRNIGRVMYFFSSSDADYAALERIAESLTAN